MVWAPRSEIDVEDKIVDVLKRFVGQKFYGVTITRVKRQYEVDGRWADIAVLKDDGKPVLIIETKMKKEGGGGWSVEKHFMPFSREVVGQAVAYAAILKSKGIYVPFVATANQSHLALYTVPENIEQLVDWEAIKRREYGRVIRDFYDYENKYRLRYRPHSFSEEFFKEILDIVTRKYIEYINKEYRLEEEKQDRYWEVIEQLRSFVDFIAPFVEQAIAPTGKFRKEIAEKLEEHARRTGYAPTPSQLAREMAYVLLNKIVFYKVLERYYEIPKLEPLYERGVVKTCSEYLKRLREYFDKAVEATRDFQAVFETGIYDEVDLVENEEVLKAIDWLVNFLEINRIEKLGDIVGFIYEDLIPGEERHQLGQFYTPKPIAELIVKWCVRSPDDRVLDPGCGSGTFLVEAYKRLAELKLKKPWSEIKHVPSDVHKQILRQLYGVDLNEFPAHLTAMNLAMKNVRAPSPEMYVFVRDYFTIMPGQQVLTPYRVRTAEGEKPIEVVFKDFDAVVGNPPYTGWNQIPEETREMILELYGKVLRNYDLRKFVTGGALPGIFIPWIVHSAKFLREGGRLGMIISDSWLGTQYGVGFVKYLADNFKIVAIIDLAERVFKVPLIGTCIILLEKTSNKNERDDNSTVFVYLKKQYDVDTILRIIESARKGKVEPREGVVISVIKQGVLYRYLEKGGVKPITLFFNVEGIVNAIASTGKVVKLGDLFQPSEGNTGWSVYASMRGRGAGTGGEEFYYLDESKVRQFNLDKYIGTYLKPSISSSDRLVFFTFTREDWEKKREYMFVANAPFTRLPPEIQKYIRLGETSILITKGPNKGKPVSESTVAKQRKRLGTVEVLGKPITFYDWYDLGGIIETPIIASRYARYWQRFALVTYNVSCNDNLIALVPRQDISSNEELKALLAYLNSSFARLQIEVIGRVPGGVGPLGLDVKPLSNLLVLDVKKLPRGDVEKLARLFDRLESEARRLGGAEEVENVFGSELAKELAGKSDVKPGLEGLFNTVIKEIDYEVARVLGLDGLVETIRAMVLELAKRRLSRAGKANPEAVKGSEELPKVEKPEKKRSEKAKAKGRARSLIEFMKKGEEKLGEK